MGEHILQTMSSHLLLLVSIASTASLPVVEHGLQASALQLQQASDLAIKRELKKLHSGHEDTVLATQHDAATPAPVDVDQAMNDINEIVSTLGEAVAALNNALATKSEAEMVAAVFAVLEEAAVSKDASLVAAADYGLILVEGMNDINEITTTLGNAVAHGQAITAQGNNSSSQAATLALLNHLAESNNANDAKVAKAILIQAKKSEAEMVATVFAALNEAAASNDGTLAAAANYSLRLVEGMNDINAIVTTLGNDIAAQAKKQPPSDALTAILDIWNRLAESNNATAANAANAIKYIGIGLIRRKRY